MELIAERGVTNLIELKNKGSMANTNQKDQFDVSHEGTENISVTLDITVSFRYWRYYWRQNST